jgi:hypothetical protein
MTDTNNAPSGEDWRSAHARMWERIRRTDEIQKSWRSMRPATLLDASRALCDSEALLRLRKHGAEQQSADRDAPPPTTEELLWLKENLIEHQQSVEKLIQLIEALLSARTHQPDSEEE